MTFRTFFSWGLQFCIPKAQNLVSTQRKEEEAEVSRQNGSKPSGNNFVQCDVNEKLPVSRDPKFYATTFPFFFSYEYKRESYEAPNIHVLLKV